ncbi:MAG: tetratricopeptide repeat protein [Caldilineales bacterium]|nr:tetratricopeptide repeat protein [Caldilineales bacterium]
MTQPLDAPALFQTYVQRMAESAIIQIQAAGQGLPGEAERDLALTTLNYALSAPDGWSAASRLLINLAPKMEQAGHRQEWIEYLEAGIDRSQSCGDVATEAELRLQLGVLYQLMSALVSSRNQLTRSAELFAGLNDTLGQVRALNRLARTAVQQGDFDTAERMANRALQLADDEAEHAYGWLVMGTAFLFRREWDEAAAFYEKSLAVWERGGDKRMMAWANTNLGSAYRRLDEFTKARQHLKLASALFAEIGDPVHQAKSELALGNTFVMTGDYGQALQHYRPAERTFRLAQNKPDLALTYLGIGSCYRHLSRWQEAEQTYRACAAIWQELDDSAKAANAISNIGLIHLAQGRHAEAIAHFKQALQMLSQAPDAPEYADFSAEFSGYLRRARGKGP